MELDCKTVGFFSQSLTRASSREPHVFSLDQDLLLDCFNKNTQKKDCFAVFCLQVKGPITHWGAYKQGEGAYKRPLFTVYGKAATIFRQS